MEKIGQAVRKIRILKGFSQENMADMLKLSLVAYGDIERGKIKPNKDRIEQIAKVLQMPVEDIESFDEKIEFIFNNTGDAYGAYNQHNHQYPNKTLKSDLEKVQLRMDLLKSEKEISKPYKIKSVKNAPQNILKKREKAGDI